MDLNFQSAASEFTQMQTNFGESAESSGDGLDMRAARDVLKNAFRRDKFKPGQYQVIKALLEGHNAAAIFPTGGGKSLCYQLPAMMLPHLTLVISPLISLQIDQVDYLRSVGLPAAHWNGQTPFEQVCMLKDEMKRGTLKMLFVAPEKLNNESAMELFLSCTVSLLAIDEAHCISEWGHAFRPDYLKLQDFARKLECQVVCLTATATLDVEKSMRDAFDIDAKHSVRVDGLRPNLSLRVLPISKRDKDARLPEVINDVRQRLPLGPVVVYCTTQKNCGRLADLLKESGIPARPYHAGMKGETRAEVQQWFCDSDRAVICATIAFGMGIDRSNLRCIIHYNMPSSLEGYMQQVGRAGRDGDPADCLMLFNPAADRPVLHSFAVVPTPTLSAVKFLCTTMTRARVSSTVSFSPYKLTKELDISRVTCDMIHAYMEIYHGAIKQVTPSFTEFKVRIAEVNKLLRSAEGDAHRWLQRNIRRAKTWATIPISEAGDKRQQIRLALAHAAVESLRPGGVQLNYQVIKHVDVDVMANDIHARMVDRERKCLGRLQQVIDVFSSHECINGQLMRYFGDVMDRPTSWTCGHCESCLNPTGSEQRQAARKLNEEEQAQAEKEFACKSAELQASLDILPRVDADQSLMLAKYLHGCSSPGMPTVFGRGMKNQRFFGFLQGCDWCKTVELCKQSLTTTKRRRRLK